MHMLTLIAQKGGTDKTILVVHVAATFEGTGGSAVLVDLGISPALQHASAT